MTSILKCNFAANIPFLLFFFAIVFGVISLAVILTTLSSNDFKFNLKMRRYKIVLVGNHYEIRERVCCFFWQGYGSEYSNFKYKTFEEAAKEIGIDTSSYGNRVNETGYYIDKNGIRSSINNIKYTVSPDSICLVDGRKLLRIK